MRILYLHQHYSTPAGALPGRSHAFAAALAARGHQVTLFCGRHDGADCGTDAPFRRGLRCAEVSGYRVVQADIPYANAMAAGARAHAFARYAARATALALRGRWDLVIASSTPLTVALPMLAAKRTRATPALFEVRDRWPDLPQAMGAISAPAAFALGRLERAALRAADAVVALSPGAAQGCIAAGADPAHVATIPNGCDRGLFPESLPALHPVPRPEGGILAIYAGAHGRANGLGALLDVAWVLQAWGERRVRLVLIGDGAEKPALVARARAERLDNVFFLDPMPRAHLARVLAGADVALHCLAPVAAFAEGTSPNKVFEALAAGLPVLTNCPGWISRILARAGAGLACPPGHPAPFAEALGALAADPARRAAMAAAARRLAATRFDRAALAARFCAVAEAAARRAPLPDHVPVPA